MIPKTPWLERRFAFETRLAAAPLVLERLRGTPARLQDRLSRVPLPVLTNRPGDTCSILEIVGHYIRVEGVHLARLDDYASGRDVLRPATSSDGLERAGYNQRPLLGLLHDFRIRRAELCHRLEDLDETALERSARHPRLNRPMRLLDMMSFVAEHDDHHLARIGEIVRTAAASAGSREGTAPRVIARGTNVLLRDRLPDDVEAYVRWQSAGEWREYDAPWEQAPPPETDEEQENLRRRFRHRVAEVLLEPRESAIIATPEGRPLGLVQRYGGRAGGLSCTVGIDICEDESLNRGLGTEALTLWIDYLFSDSDLHRIGLETWSMNPRMIHVARKLGFSPEGIEREQRRWRHAWLDRHRFGLLRGEWPAGRRREA